jgi:hypothetical protein
VPAGAEEGRHVATGTGDGGRVDIGRVQLGPFGDGGHRDADRARAAAQVGDDVTRPGQSGGLGDHELGAPARHEDAGRHGDPQPAELRPADDVLERQAAGPPGHHGVELVRCPGGLDQQPGFVLGEDAARRPEPADDVRRVSLRRIPPAAIAARTA